MIINVQVLRGEPDATLFTTLTGSATNLSTDNQVELTRLETTKLAVNTRPSPIASQPYPVNFARSYWRKSL